MFRKFKHGFLIIEKVIIIFQNLHKLMSNSYLNNEGCKVSRRVENRIRWNPHINGIFKLNVDGSRINNIRASEWAIKDFNATIKLIKSRHLGNTLTITTKCVGLRDDFIAYSDNGFLNLETKEDSKVIIYCYNEKTVYLVQIFF